MKKLIFVSVVVAFLPVYSFAHGGPMMNFDELQTAPEMMEYLEESVLGDELHEEMAGLMTRMMSGAMTQNEAERMTELMGQYPGPYGMMMVRLGSPQVTGLDWSGAGGRGMMSGWGGMMSWGGLWFWLFTLSWLVWTAAGVLLVIWLIKKLLAR